MKSRFFQHGMALLLGAALALSAGNWGCAPGAKAAPAVRINEEEIPYSEFEDYLQASLGEEAPPAQDGATRSRLLDQFIGERLLLQRANGERLRVGDDQVESYLAGLGGGPGQKAGKEDVSMKEQVRRNLLIQEYKDRVLLKDVKVSPEEVEAYFREHPEEFQQSRVVVLRQILMEDPEAARRLAAEIKEDPSRFPLLAQQNSLSPDKGEARGFEESELPEPVREAILALTPGQVSDLVADADKVRIFQLMDRREGKSQNLKEVGHRIEILLLQRKAEEALKLALEGIRQTATIQVHQENLPFSYHGDYGG
ncbi:MAG: peptidyl-prolyl cis-trans isomerase [Acidobacteria bacterium]|nr:peptidyl-prolyl cis-trans isomerase [Acidobacteriota bacterium]